MVSAVEEIEQNKEPLEQVCMCARAGGCGSVLNIRCSEKAIRYVWWSHLSKGSERANFMEIWKKQFQIEKTVSAKALRSELGEAEEQEGGQFH